MVIRLEDTDGNREEVAAPRVDERGRPHAEGNGARRNKDDRDRAQAEANGRRDTSAGFQAGGVARATVMGMPGKRVQFDDETWHALDLLARDRMMDFQELAEEAFSDLLKKHGRPTDLRSALRQSLDERADAQAMPAKKVRGAGARRRK
jgi:hypothetical protein